MAIQVYGDIDFQIGKKFRYVCIALRFQVMEFVESIFESRTYGAAIV